MDFDIRNVHQRIMDMQNIKPGLKVAMKSAFDVRCHNFSNKMQFFTHPFTPVSVTGTNCDLNCKHCSTHYLEHMVDAASGDLQHIAGDLARRGENGILLSGGSRHDGSVPTYEHVDAIKSLKSVFGLKISAHTGLVDRSQASRLREYGLDMALVDVIGSVSTIHDVYGLDRTPEDYDSTLASLAAEGIVLAPHIIVGLHGGELDGEFRALEMVRQYDPGVVVIVVFIPTDGTDYRTALKPDINDVVEVMTTAREMFPSTPLSLSCVRPGGRYRSVLDECALLCGLDRIAVPGRHCYRTAGEMGLDIMEVDRMCCSYGGT
ncbi:MAG: radical SAM protein [Methanosarcinales archaeon]|nr:radical SAM protein [Methanosarcinales archaeon]